MTLPEAERDVFRPTDQMHAYARAVAGPRPEFDGEGKQHSLDGLAGALGIDRDTILDWHKDPQFLTWLDAYQTWQMRSAVFDVHRGILAKAQDGTIGAAKLFMERFDDGYSTRIGRGKYLGTGSMDNTEEALLERLAVGAGVGIGMVLKLMRGNATIVEHPPAKPVEG